MGLLSSGANVVKALVAKAYIVGALVAKAYIIGALVVWGLYRWGFSRVGHLSSGLLLL